MNGQRIARWSLGKTNSIVSDSSDGIYASGVENWDKISEENGYYGGVLVCESIQTDVAKMIISDHEFCQSLTQEDRHNLCDLVWWMKGYHAGAEKNFNDCPFGEHHFKTLGKLVENMRSILK